MSSDLEARLLASIPSVEAFENLDRRGLSAGSFQHYRPMFQYISEVVREHRHLPRLRDLKATFNVPDWVQRKPEEFDWLVQEFESLNTARRVQEIVDNVVETAAENPQLMVLELIRRLGGIAVGDHRRMSVTDSSAAARMEAYARAVPQNGMMAGIPTGLSYFDSFCQLGWLAGELIGVVARTYIGKSWILFYFGVLAWKAGYRVLFLTPELTVPEAEARFDGLVCGSAGVEIKVSELYRGYLPTEAQKVLAAQISSRQDWVTMSSAEGSPLTLAELPRLIRQHRPQLLLVDGLPHIGTGEKRAQLWEQIKDVAYGLKNVAVGCDLPIIVAHQANRQAHNAAKPPGLHEISFGDALAQACDRVLALARPAQGKLLTVTIQKFRKGEPAAGGVPLHFDPDRGQIHELVEGARGTGAKGAADESREGASAPLPIP